MPGSLTLPLSRPVIFTLATFGSLAAAIAIWLSRSPQSARSPVNCIAFTPDGGLLAAGDREGRIVVWRTDSFRVVGRVRLNNAHLNTLAFSPDGRLLAVAGRSLQLWRTADWTQTTSLGIPGSVYGTARFSPDGRLLATVNAAEQIQLWDIATRMLVRTLCCMALYGDLAFSPNAELLAAGGHWPRLWDINSGREVRRLVETRDPTFGAVDFRPDGKVLATGSQDGKTRLWDVETGRELLSATTRPSYIETLAFHPNGTLLAYAGRDSAVWLWDTTARSERMIAPVTTSNIAFSPDGHPAGIRNAGRIRPSVERKRRARRACSSLPDEVDIRAPISPPHQTHKTLRSPRTPSHSARSPKTRCGRRESS